MPPPSPPPSPPHSRPNPTRHCVKRERGSNYIEYTMKGAVYVTPSTKVIPSLSFNYVGKYLSTTYTSVHIQHS